jgi:hypothetical protein
VQSGVAASAGVGEWAEIVEYDEEWAEGWGGGGEGESGEEGEE